MVLTAFFSIYFDGAKGVCFDYDSPNPPLTAPVAAASTSLDFM